MATLMTNENTKLSPDYRLSEIRKVTLHWHDRSPTSHLMHKDDVAMFVEASTRLHFDPGINPATGGKTSKIWQITVAELEFKEPYWWTMPCLGDGDRIGARIIDGGIGEDAWVDQEYVDRMNAEEDEMEEAWERRNYGN
jgi:hypothetical protein